MAIKKFTADGTWNSTVPGYSEGGFRCLKYSGDLGGGTLSIHSLSTEVDPETSATVETPVANAKLSAATVDGNGEAISQVVFQTTGTIVVKLTGATAPDVLVMVE